MKNPWLTIPLSDYENHMSFSAVDQARLLSAIFSDSLQTCKPSSLAVVGCAGGNGFDSIDPGITTRVIGIDINPGYISETRRRYGNAFPSLALFTGDIQTDDFDFDPVDLLFIALILEYVDLDITLKRIPGMMIHTGHLVVVTQLPNDLIPEISPSPYSSLKALGSIVKNVSSESLLAVALSNGLQQISTRIATSTAGKKFQISTFTKTSRL